MQSGHRKEPDVMIVIAERINCTRTRIKKAVQDHDDAFIAKEVRRQADAGAAFIDVNAATSPQTEVESMRWLMEIVQASTKLPISVDSANPEATKLGLELHRNGQPIINSVTGEKARLEAVLPLAVEHKALLIALTMDDSGMPETVEQRIAALEGILRQSDAAGIDRQDVFVDPLIRPVSTNQSHAMDCLQMVRRIKADFGCRTTGGFSNVSFGLPRRRVLNAAYITMAIGAGLDSAIADPTEPGLMAAIYAAEALAGRDEWCMNYITAEREGRLE
jgi:5-methyltetrahydrofolate--homocysteine methyltransferase